MISSQLNSSSKAKRTAGFTLTELIVASSISLIVLTGVLTTVLMTIRTGIRISNYSSMETETRKAFEQLGIDARMANNFQSHFTGNVITAFTLTIPSNDLTSQRQVTYGYDTSTSGNRKLYYVPGSSPSATTGRVTLINYVTDLSFLRYNISDALIPASTTSDAGVKHIQISVSVTRSSSSVAAATQVIRSSAFTIRNISI